MDNDAGSSGMRRSALPLLALAAALITPALLHGEVPPPEPPEPMRSLKTVPVPEPNNLFEFVQSRQQAIILGKALFWDEQAGSDNVQACATCHFHAGTDIRRKNQLSPGLLGGDTTFQLGGPNYTLKARDFPTNTNDVVSSQGVFNTNFRDVDPPNGEDLCDHIADPVFNVHGINTRRVEPRNAPTMVNAVFNFRNFWDGRANNDFVGASVFGQRDPNARVFKAMPDGSLQAVRVVIPLSSLASQSFGPPTSDFEMSCRDRIWAEIGEKMLDPAFLPLRHQEVHPQDSVLGPVANRFNGSKGLTVRYDALVRQAFRPEWWSSSQTVDINGEPYTQMEANFGLFFGLAVQLYEATLIADDTRLDKFLEGNSSALTAFEQQGKKLFEEKGRCINCHGGAELTNASVRNVLNERLERMEMGDGGCAIYDNGFYNIGVRPTAEDLGVGGLDPFGNPLSETRMAMQGKFFDDTLEPPLGAVPECDGRAAVDGAFKTPHLRNVELGGPYFHNGGKGTLRQVVEFYDRGGDFAQQNIANLDPDIQPIGFTNDEINALVAFLQALTDERSRQEKAPFDHPQILRPQGHPGDENQVAVQQTGQGAGIRAQDDRFEVPALGAGGRPAAGLIPLQPFLSVSKMTGSGRIGVTPNMVQFEVRYRERAEDDHDGRVEVREHGSNKRRIRSTSVDSSFTTENCVRLTGNATFDGASGYRYSARGCDNGQFADKDGSGKPVRRDTFDITVTNAANGSVVYSRSGQLTGGNVHAHIR
jgi:cytochrome c peroxidase